MSENKLACKPESRAVHAPSAPAWVLEARSLHKSYGSRHVVDDVSLHVAAGEGMALLGPNGSGKTTLLSLLAGVLRPDAGVALAAGRSVRERSARRSIAFVPQHPAVYDELTGGENVALFGKLHGLRGPALEHGVREALTAAELWPLRELRASAYSGGMRRRLSLACALVHAPALLLLDEPFEGVDDDSRAHLLEVLAASKRGGVALVLSTHRLDEVSALCERFTLLRDGRVVAERDVEHTSGQSSDAAPGTLRADS
ncbi:MAG: ABC-type multidrug transport system, ATPase component [Myxococcaceae bacterium]|nr:ABC-type multidrug transport system, ATPase component [Myxococcaceae bacterium]